ncbi:hypothetical protein DPEC_G00320280 [Dallia pectoralis]|uniref:Uncharacterized protein n=1 Tax=Dallia pectoralis TaxID=75939 RepID=A0ACC2FA05_DALPE|nr:hypothetical protein DPEC_G00320280 [Dallia pectoralis]
MESVWAVLVLLCCYKDGTEAQIGTQTDSGSTLPSDVHRLLKELTDRVQKLESERDGVLTNETNVAFSASLPTGDKHTYLGPFDSDRTMMYTEVTTNIGGAYNPETGHFTAPFQGVYFFMFSCYAGTTKKVNAELLKNGENVAGISETGNPQFSIYHGGSNGVTLDLAKGDRIYVVLLNGSSIYDHNRINKFSGHLLFPISHL